MRLPIEIEEVRDAVAVSISCTFRGVEDTVAVAVQV
jgi:hypothetical protein